MRCLAIFMKGKKLYYNGRYLIGGKSLPVDNSNLCIEETSSFAGHVRKKMLKTWYKTAEVGFKCHKVPKASNGRLHLLRKSVIAF